MAEGTIEILGQKFCYPTTWQGALAVVAVTLCIGFLGYTLDANQIQSYSSLFNGKSEEAYNESLDTISKLNQQIEGMQDTITDLTSKANLAEARKKQVYARLEQERKAREAALKNLSSLQQQRQVELGAASSALSEQEEKKRKEYLSYQQQKIQRQLGNIQQQQQQQLKITP